MQDTHPGHPAVSPTDAPLPIGQTPPTGKEIKTTPVDQETRPPRAELRILRTDTLITSTAITEEPTFKLYNGRYEGQAVTILRLSSQAFTEHREALSLFVRSASPFWLPILGVCEATETAAVVIKAIPNSRLDAWLVSQASESWVNRCRLVRDVAVGLYQRRAIEAAHLAWHPNQLYLDKEGRAQLVPLSVKRR